MPPDDRSPFAPAAVLDRQRGAFRRDGAPDVAARRDALRRLDRMLFEGADAFGAAIAADFGHRAWPETVLAELAPLRTAIRFARRHLAEWCRPRRAAVPLSFRPGRAWVVRQPLGCVGIVSPWNYPLFLSVGPLVDAIAAGNRAMIKPSELTPRFSAVLRDRLAGRFAAEEVAVVEGDEAVGRAFCALPFDHLLFTGSTRVGREVMRQAAENLTPVTLELGGKSPALVAPDATPERVARSLMIGKLFNAGQTCIAPDHVLVPEAAVERYADAFEREAARLYPRIADNPDYTAIISAAHLDRLEAMVAEARAGGAAVRRDPGHAAETDAARRGGRMVPTLLCGVPEACAVMREEIFGPVLPIIGYRSLDEAVFRIEAGDRPLALYCYTDDRDTERRVLRNTVSGGVTVNGTLLHCAVPDLPFGGIGPSGTGAYHGETGFARFSHAKGAHRAGRFGGFTALAPPHGAGTRRLLPLLLGRR